MSSGSGATQRHSTRLPCGMQESAPRLTQARTHMWVHACCTAPKQTLARMHRHSRKRVRKLGLIYSCSRTCQSWKASTLCSLQPKTTEWVPLSACCMVLVARCVLHVACCTLRVASCAFYVASSVLHGVCCTLRVACCGVCVALRKFLRVCLPSPVATRHTKMSVPH